MEKSKKVFDRWSLDGPKSLVLYKENHIFAARGNNQIFELDINLGIVRKFKGRFYRPLTIDVNENYLVIGYKWRTNSYGYVDVHSRNEVDQNGTYHKRMVSFFASSNSTLS